MASHTEHLSPEEQRKANVRRILTVTGILAAITTVEFILAFVWPEGTSRGLLNAIFVILTLFKAFYIVADFMHLRHEVKVLIWSIMIPTAFIVWFIIALMVEGSAILGVRY